MSSAKGIGFVFNGNGIAGVDLDHCRDVVTGELKSWAQRIVDDFDSYTEVSMSGTGVHIFIRGKKPGVQCKKTLDKATGEAIEIYEDGRYFAMTGNVYRQSGIAERQAVLEAIYNWLWPEAQPIEQGFTAEDAPTLDYYLAIGLERDQKLIALWNGQRGSSDESSNDQGLMNKLAYWCNRDKQAMVQAFKASPFAAQKDEAHQQKMLRDDYLVRTAEGAIAGTQATASGDNRQFKEVHSKAASEGAVQALNTFSLDELMLEDLGELEFYVDGLLHQGLIMLSADPKSGKSFLCLDICLSVASGKQVLGRDTKQCDTLYLSLEDGKRQLQSRARMVLEAKGIDPPRNFYLATAANPVDMGLIEQLAAQLEAHPNIKLIVIDILNRIRASTRSFGKNAYEIDSAEMSKLKDFTNKYNICVLIVHHNRKGRDTQAPFQNISGSQGLLGGVDEGLMLVRAPRPSREARLSVTSREMQDVELTIYLDDKTCVWRDISDQKASDERAEYEDNPVVRVVKALLDEAVDKPWLGTATELLEASKRLGITVDLTAQGVGYKLRDLGKQLYDYSNIVYTPIGNGTAPKKHHFYYLNLGPYEDDGLDENDE